MSRTAEMHTSGELRNQKTILKTGGLEVSINQNTRQVEVKLVTGIEVTRGLIFSGDLKIELSNTSTVNF